MKCDEVREMMLSLDAGSLELPAEMQEHLQVCAPCTAQLQEFRQTMALLDEWEAPEPSVYFDTRLQARLREEKASESARARGWFGWLPRPALTAMAALLVAVGVGIVSMHRPVSGAGDVAVNTSSAAGNPSVQRGTAVGDLQTLDNDDDLYANFDVLDDLDSQQNSTTNQYGNSDQVEN